jgi:hypothetical protein
LKACGGAGVSYPFAHGVNNHNLRPEQRVRKPRRRRQPDVVVEPVRVRSIEGADLVVVWEPEKTTASADAPTERIARSEVLVEQDFAEPVFPVPTPIGAVRNGPADAPHHAVIQGENYHAIQALLAAYDHSFDLIYLDPPYNTGNRDWSYNNDFVHPSDTYRPSRWLAFMGRRLRIARRLFEVRRCDRGHDRRERGAPTRNAP